MSLIVWEESFSVGIKEIDDQHKKLISLINDLHVAMKEGKGSVVIEKIINELSDYTKFHFKVEEDYFEKFSYENKDAHKKAHASFISQIADFKEQCKAQNFLLSIHVMDFMLEWLTKHIVGTDKKYTECFHKHGVK